MTGCGQPELGVWGGQNWPIFKVPPTLSLPLLPRRSRCSRSRCGALRPSADPRAGEGPTERGLTARAAPGPEGGAGGGGEKGRASRLGGGRVGRRKAGGRAAQRPAPPGSRRGRRRPWARPARGGGGGAAGGAEQPQDGADRSRH